MSVYKFGTIVNNENVPHVYSHIWDVSGPGRLVIAPKDNQVNLLLELAEVFESPFYLLYILVTPYSNHEAGRYESVDSLDSEGLKKFCTKYATYLENDARHHLWIASTENDSLLVYDNHNVIYAYGDQEKYKEILKKHELTNEAIHFPSPHTHEYHAENNVYEDMIMNDIEWKHFPLVEGVDNI